MNVVKVMIQTEDGNTSEQDLTIGSYLEVTDVGEENGTVRLVVVGFSNAEPAIDVEHLARQAEWSARTFGPGSRMGGVTDHIIKELRDEVREGTSYEDADEWIDVIILAFDGAWRSGLTPEEIIGRIKAKQARNEARVWPDWRTAEPGKAIEHDRSFDPERALTSDERYAEQAEEGKS